MPGTMADRRTSPRYALIVVATLTELDSDNKLSARTSDVSRTGCYVDALHPVAAGKMVNIALTRGDESFETLAKVVYVSRGSGMGIRFEEPIDPKQFAILERWLENAPLLKI